MELYRRARGVLPFVFTFIRTGQGAVLSLCMVRPGSGRFGVGFWVGFWVGLRARDFPTERVLSRTPLIIRTVDQNQKEAPKTLQYLTLPTACLCLDFISPLWWGHHAAASERGTPGSLVVVVVAQGRLASE